MLNHIWATLVIGFSFSMLIGSMMFWFKSLNIKDRLQEFLLAAIDIIKWTGLAYVIVCVLILVFSSNGSSFVNRATGPYAWAYWMMLIGVIILPQLYWIKRMRRAPWRWIIAISLLFTSGAFFEEFVILVTSYHRDYLPPTYGMTTMSGLLSGFFLKQLIRVVAYSILAVLIMEVKKRINIKKDNSELEAFL